MLQLSRAREEAGSLRLQKAHQNFQSEIFAHFAFQSFDAIRPRDA
jgi:hypothetical protein